jgi:hypothetical protein
MACCCAHDNEPSGYIYVELSECQVLEREVMEISAEPTQVQGPALPTVQAVSMSPASRCCDQKVSAVTDTVIEDNGPAPLPANGPHYHL